jgi:exopolysaccharide biosynthesis polyprenyl glycosylphosphotransferase
VERHGGCFAVSSKVMSFSHFLPERGQRLNFVGDLMILGGACLLASLDGHELHWKVGIAMVVTASALWIMGSRVLRQYDANNGRGFIGDLALTLILLAAVVVPMALLRSVSPRYAMATELSRFLAALPLPILSLRLFAVGFRLWRSRPIDQILILGVGSLGRLTQREIRDGGKRRNVIGYLSFPGETPDPRLEAAVLGTADDLETVLKERVVSEVYVAAGSDHPRADVQRAIRSCETFGVPFALPACGYRLARATPACSDAIADGFIHYLSVAPKPFQWEVKRLIDVLASAVALVLLAPLLIVVATAVKVTSKGPVFFRQKRVGLHGRMFDMLKFRSMVCDAEALQAALMAQNERSGPVFKMARDPRVTPVGRFMRKYSIDELPQLVNVLRGDMSVVGPRPAIPAEVGRYEAWQRRRLSVRPGLTCVWQVSGRDQVPFQMWMLLDMRYIDHWSLWEDVKLICRTVPVVLTGSGAS